MVCHDPQLKDWDEVNVLLLIIIIVIIILNIVAIFISLDFFANL